MEEFDLIDRYFLPLCQPVQKGEVGIGDDGAVLTPPVDHQLVVVTDTLVHGVHFPLDTSPYDIAWKALAVNLSDLAAMGAKPAAYSMGLTLPESNPEWLKSFAAGLAEVVADLGSQFHLPLIGGDTTKGPLTVTVTAHGWVENGEALLRSGAQVGDWIGVTGPLGDGGLGLQFALNQLSEKEWGWFQAEQVEHCLGALNRPRPKLEAGRILRGCASAAIDISDGLLADLGHILECSSAGQTQALSAELWLDSLPLSEAMRLWVEHKKAWSLPLSAGDDYQLCFTAPARQWRKLEERFAQSGLALYRIGRITESATGEQVVDVLDCEGGQVALHPSQAGYRHF